jgi:hypothetical protein
MPPAPSDDQKKLMPGEAVGAPREINEVFPELKKMGKRQKARLAPFSLFGIAVGVLVLLQLTCTPTKAEEILGSNIGRHVQSLVDNDSSNLVRWRNPIRYRVVGLIDSVKKDFSKQFERIGKMIGLGFRRQCIN